MKKGFKISVLSILIIIITFITIKQSIMLHRGLRNIRFPTRESRQLGNMSTYTWITVRKLSRRFNVSEADIFKDFNIIPENGDENIPIDKLRRKYNKTPQEIKDGLRKIIQKHISTEGKKR